MVRLALRRNPQMESIHPGHAHSFVSFPNKLAFWAYKVLFPTTRSPTVELHVGEVQLQGWRGVQYDGAQSL